MKSTGIVRKVDELGRVVIPIELRRTLGIAEKDALEIYVDDEKIILKKYKPNWNFYEMFKINNYSIIFRKFICEFRKRSKYDRIFY